MESIGWGCKQCGLFFEVGEGLRLRFLVCGACGAGCRIYCDEGNQFRGEFYEQPYFVPLPVSETSRAVTEYEFGYLEQTSISVMLQPGTDFYFLGKLETGIDAIDLGSICCRSCNQMGQLLRHRLPDNCLCPHCRSANLESLVISTGFGG